MVKSIVWKIIQPHLTNPTWLKKKGDKKYSRRRRESHQLKHTEQNKSFVKDDGKNLLFILWEMDEQKAEVESEKTNLEICVFSSSERNWGKNWSVYLWG